MGITKILRDSRFGYHVGEHQLHTLRISASHRISAIQFLLHLRKNKKNNE